MNFLSFQKNIQALSLQAPKDTGLLLSWRSNRTHWEKTLSQLGLEVTLPIYLKENCETHTWVHSSAGTYLAYYFPDLKKLTQQKQDLIPSKKRRKYYRVLRYKNWHGYHFRIHFRSTRKQFFWLFHKNWLYLFTSAKIYHRLTRQSQKVTIPQDYLFIEIKRDFASFLQKDEKQWFPLRFKSWQVRWNPQGLKIRFIPRETKEP